MPWEAGRFASALPESLTRAGPDIYTNMRRCGASARDWLMLNWPGDKTGESFKVQWMHCSQIDMWTGTTLAQSPPGWQPEQWVLHRLAQSDELETTLRSLAAAVHFRRTGDSLSAASMRALSAPGDEIAPDWLISTATDDSRLLHRQKAWLKVDGGKGKDKQRSGHVEGGKDKGKGKDKDKGKGKKGKGEEPAAV